MLMLRMVQYGFDFNVCQVGPRAVRLRKKKESFI